jgi:hypothetical protein
MLKVLTLGSALVLICIAALGQQSAKKNPEPMEGVRELFYLASAKKDALPPIRKASAPARKTAPAEQPAAPPAVPHLGLRYNLVLVNDDPSKTQLVDPDRVLHVGECFAIDLESNRSGYVFVVARQSSGHAKALLPTPEMAGEPNVINPGQTLRVPSNYCFEISDPPGTETLFVMLSRDPSDFYELYDSVKRDSEPPPQRPTAAVQLASASVDDAVDKLSKQFGTRDIVIRKVSQASSPKDAPNSVYVVNRSDKPTASIVTQIQVKHR